VTVTGFETTGGDDPQSLSDIEPAAGGQGEAEEDCEQGASDGGFSVASDARALVSGESGCQ